MTSNETTKEPRECDAASDEARGLPRVLLLMTQASFRSDGGVESGAELAISARRRGLPIDVITSREGDVAQRLRRAGIHVEIMEPLQHHDQYSGVRGLARRIYYSLSCNWSLFRLLMRSDYQIIQTNDRRAFWSGIVAASLRRVRTIDVVRDTERGLNRYRRLKWSTIFRLSDRIIVLSESMIDRWVDSTEANRARFNSLYSVVDFMRFHPVQQVEKRRLRQELGIARDAVVMIYAAGFRAKKGQLGFIRHSLSFICQAVPEATIYFVGDFEPDVDPYAAACGEVVRDLGLESRAHFLGHRNDIEQWYQVADLTVLASEREGLARCMIEALSCGTPMVSFDVASATEILVKHECGTVVPEGAYGLLADEVIRLCGDRQGRERMGYRGFLVSRELFSSEAVVDRYFTILKQCMLRPDKRDGSDD